jgi:hypothetical protein
MLVEEVDVVRTQPPQASFSHSLDVVGTAIRARAALAGLEINVEAKLRSESQPARGSAAKPLQQAPHLQRGP